MGGNGITEEERERENKLLFIVVVMVAALIVAAGFGLSCLLVLAVFPEWEQTNQTQRCIGYALWGAGLFLSLGLAVKLWRGFSAFQREREKRPPTPRHPPG